jgi:hypothetical protein
VLSRGRQVGSIEPRRVRSRQSACWLTSAPQRTHTAPSCRLGERSEEASFATPGGKSGWFCHTPSVAAARALGARAVGAKRALELAMIGDAIDARTALDWGLRGSEALRTERAMDEPWEKLKTTPCKVGCYRKRPELFLNRARPAGKLSGGMKQKLSLCCALINDRDLLILDEPTTGGRGARRLRRGVQAQRYRLGRHSLNSGAKCNRAMRTGFARLCQAL